MTTNPFYRFENSNWNTGFEPAFTPTVDALYGFVTDIPSGFGIGASLGFALKLIQNFIDERNAAPYYFNFVLVPSYPIPLPPVGSGTQTWQYYITDLQLISVHSAQKYVMDIVTTDGIVDSLTVTANTDTSYPSNYSLPLFQVEIQAYRALEIAYENGAAFFPQEYTYNSITGIATSSVARFQDCKFNPATGFGERFPIITAPFSPYWSLTVNSMSADERYMLLLINRIFNYALDATKTAADIENYILYLILPDGWAVLGGFDLTGYPRVQYTFFNNATKEALGIVGRFDTEWQWQRFFNRWTSLTIGQLAVIEITSPVTQLPYLPTVGKGYSNDPENNWYDFEQIIFADFCCDDTEYYPMPAKTADHYQFNVIPSMSNLADIIYTKIGLFDCQENFIQEIGEARIDCFRSDTDTALFDNFTAARELINSDFGTPINIGFYINSVSPSSTEFVGLTNVTPPIFATNDELINYLIALSNSNNLLEVSTVIGPPIQTTCTTINTKSFTAAEALDLENLIKSYIGTIYPDLGFSNSYEGVVYSYYAPIDEFFTISDLITWGESSGIPGFLITSGAEEGSFIFTWEIENDCGTGDITSEWIMYNPETLLAIPLFTTDPASCTCDPTPSVDYNATFTKNKKYCEAIYNIGCSYALTATPNDIKQIFFSFDLPADDCFLNQFQASTDIPSVPTGEYKFGLYNQSESALEIYSTSNPIRIDNFECFSEIIEFWGDGIVEGFEYYGNWTQRIRIGINGGGEKIQLQESLYRQSNGIHRRPANKTDLSLDLHTDYLDLPAIKAMTSATRHKFLIWKNQNIFVNGDIEVATTQDFTNESSFETLSQMKFQALVQGYQPYNNSCLSC